MWCLTSRVPKTVRIVNEKTQFVPAGDATMYPLILRNFQTSYEDNYQTVTVSGLHPESLVALPLLMELPGKAWLAITEADIENYSGMYLTHGRPNNSRILEARLAPHRMNRESRLRGKRQWNRPGVW